MYVSICVTYICIHVCIYPWYLYIYTVSYINVVSVILVRHVHFTFHFTFHVTCYKYECRSCSMWYTYISCYIWKIRFIWLSTNTFHMTPYTYISHDTPHIHFLRHPTHTSHMQGMEGYSNLDVHAGDHLVRVDGVSVEFGGTFASNVRSKVMWQVK